MTKIFNNPSDELLFNSELITLLLDALSEGEKVIPDNGTSLTVDKLIEAHKKLDFKGFNIQGRHLAITEPQLILLDRNREGWHSTYNELVKINKFMRFKVHIIKETYLTNPSTHVCKNFSLPRNENIVTCYAWHEDSIYFQYRIIEEGIFKGDVYKAFYSVRKPFGIIQINCKTYI